MVLLRKLFIYCTLIFSFFLIREIMVSQSLSSGPEQRGKPEIFVRKVLPKRKKIVRVKTNGLVGKEKVFLLKS